MEADRVFGSIVTYGSIIQLRQTLTGRLLTQCKKRAAYDILAMEVELREEGIQQSLWRLVPAESAKRDGEKVCRVRVRVRSRSGSGSGSGRGRATHIWKLETGFAEVCVLRSPTAACDFPHAAMTG